MAFAPKRSLVLQVRTSIVALSADPAAFDRGDGMQDQMTWIKQPGDLDRDAEMQSALCKGSTCVAMPLAERVDVSRERFEAELDRLERELMGE